jgi:hypothetical protein
MDKARLVVVAATLALSAFGSFAPSASADCSTLANCVQEKVGQTMQTAQDEAAWALATAQAAVQGMVGFAQHPAIVCALQGRGEWNVNFPVVNCSRVTSDTSADPLPTGSGSLSYSQTFDSDPIVPTGCISASEPDWYLYGSLTIGNETFAIRSNTDLYSGTVIAGHSVEANGWWYKNFQTPQQTSGQVVFALNAVPTAVVESGSLGGHVASPCASGDQFVNGVAILIGA